MVDDFASLIKWFLTASNQLLEVLIPSVSISSELWTCKNVRSRTAWLKTEEEMKEDAFKSRRKAELSTSYDPGLGQAGVRDAPRMYISSY